MKTYYVDVSHLTADDKETVYDKIDAMDFMTSRYYGNGNKLIGLVVSWDKASDFGAYVNLLNLPFKIDFHEGETPR